LFLGRLAHQKGAIYAIQAMKYLKLSDYSLVITGTLGTSNDDIQIKKFIEKEGLSEKIIFSGFLQGEQLEEIIANAVCVVCPAIWYENMPNTVLEAYAHGKPVVASRIGSLAEIVVDGVTGFLFEPKNSKELAKRLQCYIDNPDLSIMQGKNAFGFCCNKYSKEEHLRKLMEVFSK
jgi:glycosyltransferase involved in cell wall biosynthesis